ncbi:paraquat-inducible protein A [Mycobacterium sp. KBS0706]|uniref:paraquat-inducible protein A n=1 Tax=Mycobacterium sp. KBS0706 TaxID=2578109 RepID=UPI00110FE771|nr:paraquat-inducible protein A [Mycobacterium sp. KBS0706]TSD82675.1 paraquat-inducible protein A [Mycobacterium sp. KBS0706]
MRLEAYGAAAGGVIELADSGMWSLAALVFFASITVPVLKLAGLIYLLVTTQRGKTGQLRNRTVIYRIVEAVGRWSMIDIFMISILVRLVQLGQLAIIEPGVCAVCFGIVAAARRSNVGLWEMACERVRRDCDACACLVGGPIRVRERGLHDRDRVRRAGHREEPVPSARRHRERQTRAIDLPAAGCSDCRCVRAGTEAE